MNGFAARRLMALETDARCGVTYGERTAQACQPPQLLPRPRLGDACRNGRAADTGVAQRQLLPRLPGPVADGREGADRGDPGIRCARRLDPQRR